MDNQSNKNSLHLQNITLNSISHQSTDINYEFFKQMMNVKTYRRQIQKKIQELNQKRTKIYEKVISYEKTTEEQFRDYIRGEAPQRKKRNRRNADEIQRQYNCPTCFKKYGSEGSMYQHIKLKHPNLYEPKKKGLKSEHSESFNENDSQLAKQ